MHSPLRVLAPTLAVLAAAGASLTWWKASLPDRGEAIWLCLVTAQSVIRAHWVLATRDKVVIESRRDPTERLLLLLAFVAMMALPLLSVATPLLVFAAYAPAGWQWGPGLVLGAVGVWLFHRSHADLGRNWSPSVELHAGQSLVTTGVYSRIRHPMYAAIWLLVLAQALLVPNLIAGPAGLLAFGLMYARRMREEEAMLAARFGVAWRDYARRTGRVWPRLAGPGA